MTEHTIRSNSVTIKIIGEPPKVNIPYWVEEQMDRLYGSITLLKKEEARLEKENQMLHDVIDKTAHILSELSSNRVVDLEVLNVLYLLKEKGEGDDD